MTVHLINQVYAISSAVKLVAPGDTVIITTHEIASEAIAAFGNCSATLALLEGLPLAHEHISAPAACKVITENEWVGYTSSSEPVVSWG